MDIQVKLPPDCRDRILQFLPLADAVRYGTSSRKSLQDLVSNLSRRRHEQFIAHHCYKVSTSTLRVMLIDNVDNVPNDYRLLPSVMERVQALFRALPSSHPYENDVRELLLDLRQKQQSLQLTYSSFEDLLTAYQKVSKAHRMHSSLLSRSTVHANPRPCDPSLYSITNRDTSSPNSLTVLLEHYMGDVLTAHYLMGHSIAGLVEGLTTHGQWTNQLIRSLGSDRGAVEWYKCWVFIHSSLLRRAPFTAQQRPSLGLFEGGVSIFSNDCLHPHLPFTGCMTSVTKDIEDVMDCVTRCRSTYSHKTLYNQFGPLGPAFRGRDRVESNVMRLAAPARQLRRMTTDGNQDETKHYYELEHNPMFQPWLLGQDEVVQWMSAMRHECTKTRPMTVMPPLVTFEQETLEHF